MHRLYWDARVRWANELSRSDPALFRHARSVRPGRHRRRPTSSSSSASPRTSRPTAASPSTATRFGGEATRAAGLGTTNVDYSLALYEHFQTLRTLSVDAPPRRPHGLRGQERRAGAGYREEKIDLPPSPGSAASASSRRRWRCRATRVELSVEAVYSILAPPEAAPRERGPRSVRFQLTPGSRRSWCSIPGASPSPAAARPWRTTRPPPPPRSPRTSSTGRRSPPVIAAPQSAAAITDGPRRDQDLGPPPPLGAGAPPADLRPRRGPPPRVGAPEHLDRPPRRDALRPRPDRAGRPTTGRAGSNLSLLAGAAHPDPRVMAAVQQKLFDAQHASADEARDRRLRPARRDPGLAPRAGAARSGHLRLRRRLLSLPRGDALRTVRRPSSAPSTPSFAEGKRLAAEKRVKVRREEALAGGRRLYVFDAGNVQAEAVYR